jgi:hypothetical protein
MGLRSPVQALLVVVHPHQPHVSQRSHVGCAQALVLANSPVHAGAGDACLGVFPDRSTLELGPGALYLQGDLTLQRGYIDRVRMRLEEGALDFLLIDYLTEKRERPRQRVGAHDDQNIAFGDPFSMRASAGPCAVSARCLLFMDLGAACGLQNLWLGQRGLILDELGQLPFNASGGALLFNLLSKLYDRTNVVITTNLSFRK